MEPQQPTARGLVQLFRAFEDDLLARLARRGYRDVTPGHLNVLRHLDPAGLSVVALARDAGLTKQAVSKTVMALAAKGYLTLAADNADARAKVVRYTAKGRRLIADAIQEIVEIEGRWRDTLGAAAHAQLRIALERLLTLYPKP